MKHIIIGGDGFVGRHLGWSLAEAGEEVIIADINERPVNITIPHFRIDITRPETLKAIDLKPDDAVYNLAARMLCPITLRAKRHDHFWPVNYEGVRHILEWMSRRGSSKLVSFTTDMIYGHSHEVPMTENAHAAPLGEYGASKLAAERLCEKWRAIGMDITIFRPRVILGPGRFGILTSLFKLIRSNLPVPMIGSGNNPFQFISVFDCASAAVAAWSRGFPNKVYNLGSDNPPTVRELLGNLISTAGSRSILLPTPARLVKAALTALDCINLPLMVPEQFLIADEIRILDTGAAKNDLGWKPIHRDEDMLKSAYIEHLKTNE